MAGSSVGRSRHVKPDYTGLQLQTSASTLPIPIFYGRQQGRAERRLLVSNFRRRRASRAAARAGCSAAVRRTGYDYTADLIMALCEGPIGGYRLSSGATNRPTRSSGSAWPVTRDDAAVGLGLSRRRIPGPRRWPIRARPMSARANYQSRRSSADDRQPQFRDHRRARRHRRQRRRRRSRAGDLRFPDQRAIWRRLRSRRRSTRRRCSARAATARCRPIATRWESPSRRCCQAQEQASSMLSRWLQIVNCAAVWTGGEAQVRSLWRSGDPLRACRARRSARRCRSRRSRATAPIRRRPSSSPRAANFVSDGGVVYSFTGAALTYVGASAPTAAGEYGISPAGTYLFHPGDQGSRVTIAADRRQPRRLCPEPDAGLRSDRPRLHRRERRQGPRAGAPRRSLQPADHPAPRVPVAQQPIRRDAGRGARSIADRAFRARGSARPFRRTRSATRSSSGRSSRRRILQRGLYVRTQLHVQACPGNIACSTRWTSSRSPTSISGSRTIPFASSPSRRTTRGCCRSRRRNLCSASRRRAPIPRPARRRFSRTRERRRRPINPPLIFEPPPALTGNVAQVWVGASGGAGGVADPNWGGAFVWASVDNTTYSQIGTITQPLRQGVLTAALANASGCDITDTLAVNLAESGGALSGTSAPAAQSGATLSARRRRVAGLSDGDPDGRQRL